MDSPEEKDESFEIISEKEDKLKKALGKVETDYISSEINLGACGLLIKFYKEEIKKEADKNAN